MSDSAPSSAPAGASERVASWPAADAEDAAPHPLAAAFATVGDVPAGASFAGARAAAVAALERAVVDYVADCRAEGLSPGQTLVRLNDVTRRHALADQRSGLQEASALVFRAFLGAYYA